MRFLASLLAYVLYLTAAVAQVGVGSRIFLLSPSSIISRNFLTNPTLPAWLDVSSIAGNRTMYDSTGTLTWAPNNQYINSNSSTNTARTIATSAGINYYIWIQTSSGSATIVASGTNTTTFNGSAGGTFTAFTATSGTLTLTPTTNFANITQVVVAQITYESALRSGDNVVTGAAAYYGPRFDYDPSTLAANGLLIEESRTNVITQSGDLSNAAWTKTLSDTSGTKITAPDGTASFVPVNDNVSNAGHTVQSATATVSSAATVIGSIYLKQNTSQYAVVYISDAVAKNYAILVDLQAGTILGNFTNITAYAAPNSSAIQSVGNGVYRVSLQVTLDGGITSAALAVATNVSGSTSSGFQYAGTGTGFYAWGGQLEQATFSTSYIPTTSASVTRVADIIKLSTQSLTIMQGVAGTVLQEINLEGNTAANQYGIYGNTVSPIYLDSTPAFKATNGTTVLSSGVSAVVGTAIRAGLAWDGGPSRAISVNGSAEVTDANSFGSIGATEYLGSNNGANTMNGWVRALSFYNSKLTGSTFTAKTTTGGPL